MIRSWVNSVERCSNSSRDRNSMSPPPPLVIFLTLSFFQSQETSSILTMIERKLLWVLEMYSFFECLATGKLVEKSNQLLNTAHDLESKSPGDDHETLIAEEAEFCRFNANLCHNRSIKVPSLPILP
jgi:hypothetical protein